MCFSSMISACSSIGADSVIGAGLGVYDGGGSARLIADAAAAGRE